jgi:hypothetical protein
MLPCKWFIPMTALLLAACTATQPLIVHSHTVRDQANHGGTDAMARNEKLRRLHGAVSMEERGKLLGQYYTIRWHETERVKSTATILFEYQQGGSGSTIKTHRQDFPPYTTRGVAEFSVIGDDYFSGGKVLAWRATLLRGNETIATRQSYLWQ